MARSELEELFAAASRNLGAVLSLPSSGMWRHTKSRLLAADPEGIWVESVPNERVLLDELINTSRPATVSFKRGHDKAMFASHILARVPDFQLNGGTQSTVEALKLSMPLQIKFMQRRIHYRVKVVESDLQVRVWRISENARLCDTPPVAQEIAAAATDISVGGLGVVLTGADGEPPKVLDSERVRVQVLSDQGSMVLEGRVRRPAGVPEGPTLRCGIRWVNAQDSIEGRRLFESVNKLVAMLQRRELRRMRLGLTAA